MSNLFRLIDIIKNPMCLKISTLIIFLCLIFRGISVQALYSSQLQTQSTRRSPSQSRPPYMQYLKSFKETEDVTRAVLKNGLTVLVNEQGSLPVVTILVLVRAGYFHEPDDLVGISHVMEHMYYKGTKLRGVGVIADEVRALGGELHSATFPDHTSYRIVAPSAQWKKALEIQADALLHPIFDAAELKREIEVILQENRHKLDDPCFFGKKKLHELAFTKHRIRRWPWGEENVLRALSRKNLIDYHKALYNPSRIILVVSGDVITSEILNEVVRHYRQRRKPGNEITHSPAESEQSTFRYRELRGSIPRPMIFMGFHTPAIGSEDQPALEVLAAMLGEGEGSVLSRRLREQKKAIHRGSVQLQSLKDVGFLTISLEVEPARIDQSEIETFTEIEILKRQAPYRAEVERAIAQLENTFWSTIQTTQNKASTMAYFESLDGWTGTDDYLSGIRNVTPAAITKVAKKYLRFENCSMLEYLPEGLEPRKISVETARKTILGLLEPAAEQEIAARERQTELSVELPERATAFTYSEVRHPMKKASILRGPELYIKEDHMTPMVHLGVFFPGGRLLESKENNGITALMLRSMLRGTKERSAVRFYRQLEIYGGKMRTIVSDDYFGIYLTVLSNHVERGLDLIVEAIKYPKFDPDEFERQKELQSAEIKREETSAAAYSCGLMKQNLFGEFPYGLNALGNETSLSALTVDKLRSWYEQTVKNRKPMVVIIGDTNGTSLARYFVHNFSGSRYKDTRLPENFPKPIEEKVVVEKSLDRAQSLLILAFQAPPDGDDDSYPLEVLQNYLSGRAGPLFDRLRDQRALASSVSFRYLARLRGGRLVAIVAHAPENEVAVQKVLEEEIQRLIQTPLPFREYRSAVNVSVGLHWIRQEAFPSQIAAMTQNILVGKTIDDWVDHPARLEEVQPSDLQEVARRFLKMEKSVTIKLRGRSDQATDARVPD